MSFVQIYSTGSTKPDLSNNSGPRLFCTRHCLYCYRVLLLLEAKKSLYSTIFIDVMNKPEWLCEVCPGGRIPTLNLNDGSQTFLTDSLQIVEYLDRKYPNEPLVSGDPLKNAMDRALAKSFDHVISYICNLGTTATVDIALGIEFFQEKLRVRGTPFFGGEKPGMLDYMIWPWCEQPNHFKTLLGNRLEFNEDKFVLFFEWRDRMMLDDAVQSFYLDGIACIKTIQDQCGTYQ